MVVLDLVFPEYETDGYRMLEALKQHPHTAFAYYILMSSEKQDLLHRLRSYQLEAQDFIAKPFEVSELIKKVHLVLSKKGESV